MSRTNLSYTFNDAGFNRCIDAQLETLFPLNLDKTPFTLGGSDLGTLRNVPMEILIPILEEIPLLSLICFRNSNRLARHIVDTMHKFRIIVEQAPQAIRGTLAVQIKAPTTLLCLFKKLRQQHCDVCSDLAQLLWLPTTERYCARCINLLPFPVLEKEVIQAYGLRDKDLTSIPRFRLLPATLIDRDHKKTFQIPEGHHFYDSQMVGNLAKDPTGFLAQLIEDRRAIHEANRRLVYTSSSEQPVVLPSHLVPRYVRCSAAIIIAPWISNHGAEMGVFCSLCLYTRGEDILYTAENFQNHIKNCRVQRTNLRLFSRRYLDTPSDHLYHMLGPGDNHLTNS